MSRLRVESPDLSHEGSPSPSLKEVAARFLSGETSPGLSALLRLPLIPLGWFYGGIVGLRTALYRRRWLAVARLPIPVISVGNVTLGGTGKTPFVRTLARRLIARGERPLILGRGYGAMTPGGLDEEGASLTRDLPEALVIQSPDRFAAARPQLPGTPPFTVAVLDDGAQALRFHRDLEIVLVDGRRPFGAGFPLPAGSLREFAGGLKRADVIVATRTGDLAPEERAALKASVRGAGAHDHSLVFSDHAPDHVGPDTADPDTLAGCRAVLISAIARPMAFETTVKALGCEVLGHLTFPDHHGFSSSDVQQAHREGERLQADLILCTGKDAPKLLPLDSRDAAAREARPLRFLEVAVRLLDDGNAALDRALDRVLAHAVADAHD